MFEREFGPLTVQERVDTAGAIGAYASAAAAGVSDISPEDFLPSWSTAAKRREQTSEEMMAVMRGFMRPTTKGV